MPSGPGRSCWPCGRQVTRPGDDEDRRGRTGCVVMRRLFSPAALLLGLIAILATSCGGSVPFVTPTATKDQLAKIFRGDVTDWTDVGGTPGPIHVFMREVGAATRSALESYVFGGKPPAAYAKNTIEVGSYDEILKAMHNFSGSISIVSMRAQAIAEPTTHLLAIDGIAATHQMLAGGKYPMSRPLFFVYANDPAKVKPAIKTFMDWVKGPQGQAVLDSL